MMDKIVYLLVFCFIFIGYCECVNVTMNIKYKGSSLNCEDHEQVNLMIGDEIQLITKLPSIIRSVDYMWCSDNTLTTVVRACNRTGTECISERIPFREHQQGTWECTYFFNTTRPVPPFGLHIAKNYTSLKCKLYFKPVEELWFTGLDPDRRIIEGGTALSGGFIYVYTYENGEQLNVSCQCTPDSVITRWDLKYERSRKLKTNLTGRFEIVADDSLDGAMLDCQSRKNNDSTVNNIRLVLKSKTPVLHTRPTWAPRIISSTRLTTENTKAPISGFENLALKIEGINLNSSKDSNATHLLYSFSEPKNISMKCIINKKEKYTLTLLDLLDPSNTTLGTSNKYNNGIGVSYNFTLENSNRILICKAEETASVMPRKLTIKACFKYEPITTSAVSTRGDGFLKGYWPIIVICCTAVLIICVVVAGLVKVLRTRNKSQPPDDYVNLTSDRGVNYPAKTVPNRTMPTMQPNYCNPKDIQGRRNNIEPNYSEAKESQGMGDGLYAELNRPENTYAEPYIDKNELYAQPIPKAERRKKDDPNYGNVFGQDYVNSRK